MKNNTQYPDYIVEDVRKNMGLDGEDDSKDDEISSISKQAVLTRYLNWNGLIGWAPHIIEAVEDVYGIELSNQNEEA